MDVEQVRLDCEFFDNIASMRELSAQILSNFCRSHQPIFQKCILGYWPPVKRDLAINIDAKKRAKNEKWIFFAKNPHCSSLDKKGELLKQFLSDPKCKKYSHGTVHKFSQFVRTCTVNFFSIFCTPSCTYVQCTVGWQRPLPKRCERRREGSSGVTRAPVKYGRHKKGKRKKEGRNPFSNRGKLGHIWGQDGSLVFQREKWKNKGFPNLSFDEENFELQFPFCSAFFSYPFLFYGDKRNDPNFFSLGRTPSSFPFGSLYVRGAKRDNKLFKFKIRSLYRCKASLSHRKQRRKRATVGFDCFFKAKYTFKNCSNIAYQCFLTIPCAETMSFIRHSVYSKSFFLFLRQCG